MKMRLPPMEDKLTEEQYEVYVQCLGYCDTCLLDGGCELQDVLTKYKEEASDD